MRSNFERFVFQSKLSTWTTKKKKTSWVLIPFAYDLENKQSYESFFLSGIFIIYLSQTMLPARMSQKTNRNLCVSFGKRAKKYTTKTNNQTNENLKIHSPNQISKPKGC